MLSKILVAFATKYGSTQEVADTLAATLRECGLDVDVQPMRQVRSVERYDAVIMGAPLYMFHWHKDALGFLSRHRGELVKRPLAIFALGPIHNEKKEFHEARSSLAKELAKFPWLAPVAIEIFGGKMEPARFRLPESLIPALRNMPASDIRDWEAIRAWATNLANQFQSARAEAREWA